METRIEKDSLGQLAIPAEAYFGIHTQRAINNFPISNNKSDPDFIWATAAVKLAAAKANLELKIIKKSISAAIIKAAEQIMAGKYQEYFVVDVFQAGAGTSHHMNVNEVIANIAIESLGGKKGDYHLVHPNDHVNFGQSTNDVFPTAMRLAILKAAPSLLLNLSKLIKSLSEKGRQFSKVIKSGRTHLQDAVPVTLGQEFKAYARTLENCLVSLNKSLDGLKELGIGGSATGTGLNTHPKYRFLVVKNLSRILKTDLRPSSNLFESMQSMRPFLSFSSGLRECALELIRIANDIRLLSSGPNTGLKEINLPPLQPGSSIMPGKVNPVMAEMLTMVCFQVIGNDTTIMMATQAGQLEINVMMPVIIYNIMNSLKFLANATEKFNDLCIKGITANESICKKFFENSMGLATVLNTIIGYNEAAKIMKKAQKRGKSVMQIIHDDGILSQNNINKIFSRENLTTTGIPKKNNDK